MCWDAASLERNWEIVEKFGSVFAGNIRKPCFNAEIRVGHTLPIMIRTRT